MFAVSINRLNILIVDDNEDHQILMGDVLKQHKQNVEVVFACTGEECINRLSNEVFDAIIIDYSLSDMNGIEVLKRLNCKENHSSFDHSLILYSIFRVEIPSIFAALDLLPFVV